MILHWSGTLELFEAQGTAHRYVVRESPSGNYTLAQYRETRCLRSANYPLAAAMAEAQRWESHDLKVNPAEGAAHGFGEKHARSTPAGGF